MSKPLHKFDDETHHCVKCNALYEQCVDGISCGPVRCSECTLLRPSYGGICDECRHNMLEASRVSYREYYNQAFDNASLSNRLADRQGFLTEAALEDMCIQIRGAMSTKLLTSSVMCTTCQDTGEVDETLGGIGTSNPHAPCPDCWRPK
jgi:hypothetical protein